MHKDMSSLFKLVFVNFVAELFSSALYTSQTSHLCKELTNIKVTTTKLHCVEGIINFVQKYQNLEETCRLS